MAGSSKKPEKRQASLTSFFTPRTVNGLSQSIQKSQSRPEADSDNQDSSPSARKRPLEDDTDNGNDGPSRSKRTKSHDDASAAEKSTFFSKSPAKATPASPGSRAIARTERYVYDESKSTDPAVEDNDEDASVRRRKDEMHKKFVKKLGHPDSIAQIKRRNWQITEETAALDGEDAEEEDEEEEAPRPAKATKKKGAKTGKLTPMEVQFLDIKRKHMDTVLIVEVGYKFKFFGEDARTAAKELSIVCIPGKFRYDERESPNHSPQTRTFADFFL